MRRFFYAVDYAINDNKASNNNHKSSNDNNLGESPHPKLSELNIGDTINLPESITHHWCRVLRASLGDQGVLFDGFGGEYLVELATISKKQATATLLAYTNEDRTAAVISKIGLVMSRGERMDYAIQKATELGVTAIQLLTSHHGEVTLKPAQVNKKLEHWQQIAIAACEQCGLNRPPLILAPLSITAWLHSSNIRVADKSDNNLNTKDCLADNTGLVSSSVAMLSQDPYYQVLDSQADIQLVMSVPSADQPLMPAKLKALYSQPLPYVELLIGPEGGLSPNECQQAEQAGFLPWQIGNRVLRTETAPVVALATLQALSYTY